MTIQQYNEKFLPKINNAKYAVNKIDKAIQLMDEKKVDRDEVYRVLKIYGWSEEVKTFILEALEYYRKKEGIEKLETAEAERQKRQRITEIQAALEIGLFADAKEELRLQIELQILEELNFDCFGRIQANAMFESGIKLMVLYDKEKNNYEISVLNKAGQKFFFYRDLDSVEKTVEIFALMFPDCMPSSKEGDWIIYG